MTWKVLTSKTVSASSIGAFLTFAALGGWITSGVMSSSIVAIENAIVKGCENDACGEVYVIGENGELVSTGLEVCLDNPDSDRKCSMDGLECSDKKCCPWWKFWC